MAARQAFSWGRGTIGAPLPRASAENGFQTALAKSPPRWARPITACWAPFMPPGSGAIRAMAATMRTISQAPNPNRPSRAVSTVPATVCQTSRNPASASTPALKTNSMSPSTESRPAPISPRKASTSRVARSASANRPRSMVWAATGPASKPERPKPTHMATANRSRRAARESRRFFRDSPGRFAVRPIILGPVRVGPFPVGRFAGKFSDLFPSAASAGFGGRRSAGAPPGGG